MRPVPAKLRVVVVVSLTGAAVLVWILAGVALTPESIASTAPDGLKTKYTEFQHGTKAHRMDCASCHKFPSTNWNKVRDPKTAFPDITDYPKHDSCIRCHMQQFFKGARPAICSICHTNPGPRGGTRFPYPNPRELFDKSPKAAQHESDFVVGFPHDKHIEIVSQTGGVEFVTAAYSRHPAEESCAVCHQTMSPQGKSDDEFLTKLPPKWGDAFWLKKGTFKSQPTGHATCFTCHSADTGIMPTGDKCAACHTLKPPQPPPDFDAGIAKTMGVTEKVMLDAWRGRHSAGAFRHEWFSHAEAGCSTCHNVQTMNTADPATTRVGIASCASCHATATSDDGGALNFEVDSRKADPKFNCTKCHIVFGKAPVPVSHLKALAGVAGK